MKFFALINYFENDYFNIVYTSAPGIILTPLNYYWLVYLDKILPARTFKVICKKIILDQVIGAPVFLVLFIIMVCLAEGKNMNESLKEVYQKFLFMYLVKRCCCIYCWIIFWWYVHVGNCIFQIDWIVWPPAQAINFYLIPSHLRMAFVNLIIVGWNVFLSYAKNNVS